MTLGDSPFTLDGDGWLVNEDGDPHVELHMLFKDPSSGGSGCRSVYLAENGDLVIQGLKIDDATRANLHNVLPGEDAVRISVDIVEGALAKFRSEHGAV